MIDGKGNSGVQFRSIRIPHHEMSGYQADIGEGYWGIAVRRIAPQQDPGVRRSEEALKALNKTDWNHYVVSAIGDKIVLSLNGKRSVEYHEPDAAIARSGLLAVQIHAGGPMEVQFKDVMIQPLPIPTESSTTSPGFHLRTLKTDQGERKYSVYVPEGYDGTRVFPVILFLHGAGERGQDGITPAQVGIGPAIFNRPHGVPAIVVFPQARRTWAAGSADSNAALAALDDVMNRLRSRPAARDPDRAVDGRPRKLGPGRRPSRTIRRRRADLRGRQARVTPPSSRACRSGRSAVTPTASRPLLDMRAMVEALQHEGASPRITEYRGVGHQSWDRVYNDPEVIDWMLAQRKP